MVLGGEDIKQQPLHARQRVQRAMDENLYRLGYSTPRLPD
jgi:hypothetical protein